MIVVLPFLTRRNHRYWIMDHGELVPVEFEGGLRGGMAPPPGMMGPHGQVAYPSNIPQQQPGPYGQAPPQMGGYQSPYSAQQNPYSDVVKNVSPPPGYYRQPTNQPGPYPQQWYCNIPWICYFYFHLNFSSTITTKTKIKKVPDKKVWKTVKTQLPTSKAKFKWLRKITFKTQYN